MKTLFLFISILLCIHSIHASDLKYAMTYAEKRYLPFTQTREAFKGVTYYGMNNPEGIADKIYLNFQLTDFVHADDNQDAGMSICLKFKIGPDMYLGIADLGGALEHRGYSLFTTDGNYNLIETLEAGVSWCYVKAKQFKITDSKEVYVYQLVPTTSTSIPFESFRSVDAYLKCTIYRIDSAGQFIKISETRSENTRTLTRDELNDDSKNLWDWFQLKPATGVVTSLHE